MPRGHAPKGGFYSAHKVDNAFFEPQAEEDRDSVIRLSMPFLHSLIYSKIEEANISRGKKRLARVSSNTSKRNDETEGKRFGSESLPESLEGISHSEEIETTLMEKHRLKHVCMR